MLPIMTTARVLSAVSAAQTFPAPEHDHARCVRGALERAVGICLRRGVRLTDLRRRVLELVWQSHEPVGAYRLLEMLTTERGRVAPPTVYRVLDFLAEQGLVHRIDSLNAFVGCAFPSESHKAYFLICRACRNAVELADATLQGAISSCARRAGFMLEAETVELTGLCSACRLPPGETPE
jgi:Fur family transcriptional regulator, zinc uptake regulator